MKNRHERKDKRERERERGIEKEWASMMKKIDTRGKIREKERERERGGDWKRVSEHDEENRHERKDKREREGGGIEKECASMMKKIDTRGKIREREWGGLKKNLQKKKKNTHKSEWLGIIREKVKKEIGMGEKGGNQRKKDESHIQNDIQKCIRERASEHASK